MSFGHDFKSSSSLFIGIENFTMYVGLFYVFVYVQKNFMVWEHKTPRTPWTITIDNVSQHIQRMNYIVLL